MSYGTGTREERIARLKKEIETADAVVIGAGAGLSTSAGFTYSGERFQKYFSDFEEKTTVSNRELKSMVEFYKKDLIPKYDIPEL